MTYESCCQVASILKDSDGFAVPTLPSPSTSPGPKAGTKRPPPVENENSPSANGSGDFKSTAPPPGYRGPPPGYAERAQEDAPLAKKQKGIDSAVCNSEKLQKTRIKAYVQCTCSFALIS